MRKVYLSGLVLSILLSGCGGGGGDGGTASTTPPPSTGTPPTPPPEAVNPPPSSDAVKLIESFSVQPDWRPYIHDVTGNIGYLYDLTNCSLNSLYQANIKIYSDANVESSFETNKYKVNDTCVVARVFSQQKPNDGKIEANYINGYTFYDQNSKIYYDVDYPSNEVTKLISITNDGMTAVVQYQSGKTTNTKIFRAYKQINLADAGIKPKPITFFSKGNPSDIMELGIVENIDILNTPYSLEGNLYLYKTVGVTKNYSDLTQYVILNDTQIAMQNSSQANVQSGYITDVFERVYPQNQKSINAQYISNQTFYDSKSKVYFEVKSSISGTDMIVDTTNDGNTAVLQDGRILQIVKSYKKVL